MKLNSQSGFISLFLEKNWLKGKRRVVFAMEALGIMIMATYETFMAVYDARWTIACRIMIWLSSCRQSKTKGEKETSLGIGRGTEFNLCASLRLVLMTDWLGVDMLKIAEKRAQPNKRLTYWRHMFDLSKAGQYDLSLVAWTQSAICKMRWK